MKQDRLLELGTLKPWSTLYKEGTKEVIKQNRWLELGRFKSKSIFQSDLSKLVIFNKPGTFRDIAVISEAGYGQIVGRMKDMIIRGGENIYPR